MSDLVEVRYTTDDGLSLVGDCGGPDDGPSIIFLHGGGQTRHSWRAAMHLLAERGYHVCAYDARGHGESDWSPEGDYALPALSADLRTVLRTRPGPVALVGASMGGMTSFYTIGTAEQPVAWALVMVDIVLRPAASGVEKIREFMSSRLDGFASLEEAADAVAAYNPLRPRPTDPSGLRRSLRQREDGRLVWHWDPRLILASPSSEPPSFTANMIEAAPRVTLPTLLVRGGQSDVVDDAGTAEMCRLVPSTEVVEVPGAGHMVVGDRNDAFAQDVATFLDRHAPR